MTEEIQAHKPPQLKRTSTWKRNEVPYRELRYELELSALCVTVDGGLDENGVEVPAAAPRELAKSEYFYVDAPSASVHSTPDAQRRYARALLDALYLSFQASHKLLDCNMPLFVVVLKVQGQFLGQVCKGGGS